MMLRSEKLRSTQPTQPFLLHSAPLPLSPRQPSRALVGGPAVPLFPPPHSLKLQAAFPPLCLSTTCLGLEMQVSHLGLPFCEHETQISSRVGGGGSPLKYFWLACRICLLSWNVCCRQGVGPHQGSERRALGCLRPQSPGTGVEFGGGGQRQWMP